MKPSTEDLGNLVLEVFRLNACLLMSGDKLVEPFGINSARWQVLGAAVRSGGTQTLSQIARDAGLSRQAVQRTASAIQADGLVCIRPNPQDKRGALVEVTEKGYEAYKHADKARRDWLGAITDEFDKAEIDNVVSLLSRFRESARID